MHSVFSALKLCFFAFYFQYRNNIHIPFLSSVNLYYLHAFIYFSLDPAIQGQINEAWFVFTTGLIIVLPPLMAPLSRGCGL